MAAYYNEIDDYAAKWLRNLISAGHIAPGDVDTRSIEDVHPDDLKPYKQCHFFAGVGVWSYALRLAGVPDDAEVWSGSCPCQPFSAAGKGAGFTDERHLWPSFNHLIGERRPAKVYGEQVASKDAEPWLDLVQADLEALGFAFGALAFPSASIGAPHIRDRTYWVADSDCIGFKGQSGGGGPQEQRTTECSMSSGMGPAQHVRPSTLLQSGGTEEEGGLFESQGSINSSERPGPTNGIWRDADWLLCRDGKWRPVEPSAQQMVDGSTESLGRLCPEDIKGVEESVTKWSIRHKRDGVQAVRDLWDLLSQEEANQRTDGGFDSIQEAPFLLSFLRQLSNQGWGFPLGAERTSSEASKRAVRVLRYDREPYYSSRGRGLDEQLTGEFTDPLRQLSQIVAYHTEKCWGKTGWKNAGSFPLIIGATSRVGRLRAYGNAINAQQAKEFIRATL